MSAVDVIMPYTPIETVIDLPFPPSVNEIWRYGAAKVHRNPGYVRWIKQADMRQLLDRSIRRRQSISGPFSAHIELNMDAGMGDLDNRIKAVLDYAQSREFIANDKFCRRLTAEWVVASKAPHGCRLTLRECAG